jgi:phosphate transport system substrate-binding protein
LLWQQVVLIKTKRKQAVKQKQLQLPVLPFRNLFTIKFLKLIQKRKDYWSHTEELVRGIRSLKDKIVDFGASDAYLSDEKMKNMPMPVLHIPTCLGAVVAAYNLPGKPELKFTSEIMEGIFMGQITQWNDPKIAKANPEANLPDLDITVVYRSDGSGTTYIFSDYMCKVSQKWNNEIGRGKALQWPTGIGAKGNPGVAGTISQTKGAIGYIGSEYAFAMGIQMASIQNKTGHFILPSVESVR